MEGKNKQRKKLLKLEVMSFAPKIILDWKKARQEKESL